MSALLTRQRQTQQLPWTNPTYMAGTEGTGLYTVESFSELGRVGVRNLGYARRVRVEPTEAGLEELATLLTRENGWKQPGDQGQDRFSKVILPAEREDVVEQIIDVLNPQVSPTRSWRHRLLVAGLTLAASAALIYWMAQQRQS